MRDGADYKGKEVGMEVDEEKALLERRTPVLSQAHLQPAHLRGGGGGAGLPQTLPANGSVFPAQNSSLQQRNPFL